MTEPRIDNAPTREKRMAKEETVNYRAKSVFTSKTMIFNQLAVIATILGSDQLKAMLGPQALEYTTLGIAVINMILRFGTVRPVALISPGKSKPVPVEKLAA